MSQYQVQPDLNRASFIGDTNKKLLSTPIEGQLWFNTTKNKLYVFDGTGWLEFQMFGDISANWGTICDGEQIPLPTNEFGVEYTYSDCAWLVSPKGTAQTFDYMLCYTDEQANVTVKYGDTNTEDLRSGTANYMIVAIKGNNNIGRLLPCDAPPPVPSQSPPAVTPSLTASPTSTPAPGTSVSATATPAPTPTRTPTREPSNTPVPLSPGASQPVTPTPDPTPDPTPTPEASQPETPPVTQTPVASQPETPPATPPSTPPETPPATPPETPAVTPTPSPVYGVWAAIFVDCDPAPPLLAPPDPLLCTPENDGQVVTINYDFETTSGTCRVDWECQV